MTRIDELEERVWGRHDWSAAAELAALHRAEGHLDEVARIACAVEDHSQAGPDRIDRWLDTPDLRARAITQLEARAGREWEYAEDLATVLLHWGRIDLLRARAAAGDYYATMRAADWLVARGSTAEAIDLLLTHAGMPAAETASSAAAHRAVDLLLREDRSEEARAVLTAEAGRGDWRADERLVELLVARDDLAAVRARADAGSTHAREYLAERLAAEGAADELRTRADAGDLHAARSLATLLASTGDEQELRTRAAAHDRAAAETLADLLISQGRTPEAVDVLTAAADAGDLLAAERLIMLQREDPTGTALS